MKKLLLFSIGIALILATISCNKSKTENTKGGIYTDTAVYSIKIKSIENNNWSNYFYNNLEISKHKYFISALFDGIKKGEITAYDFNTMKALSLDEAKNIGITYDTVEMPDTADMSKVNIVAVENPLDIEKVSSIIFKEVWTFDSNKNLLTKEIISFCPVVDVFYTNPETETQEIKVQQPLFWVKNGSKCSKESKEIAENIISSVCPTSELTINKLPKNLMNIIAKSALDKASKDTNNIFNTLTLDEKLSYTELKNNLTQVYTNTVVSVIDPMEEKVTTDTVKITPEKIDFITFNEKWDYDAKNNCFCKKINAIGFGYSVYYTNELGEQALKGYKILFVLKM